jgi:thiosulfate/3-mercaptopyruvate sulfurtransferase
MHTTLISTDQLNAHLNDSSWLVADCRYNLKNELWGREQYLASHIAGAVFVSLAYDLAAPRTGSNGRHPLPAPEAIATTFARIGIGHATQVIAYDQDVGAFASRLWWMLRYLGHDAVAVLDGGFAKWTREGHPTRTGEETRPAATFTPRLRAAMRVTADEVLAQLGDPSMLLVDARSPERYQGQPDPLDNVSGHIPGARNRFYRHNVGDAGTMRAAGELKADFERVLAGQSPNDTVMYCGSGVTACYNLLAMEHAGLGGAKLFAGSWSEWEADPTRPIERSKK